MKNWSFIALVFVIIALIWGAYFFVKAYSNSGDIKMAGEIYSEGKALPGASIYMGEDMVTSDIDGTFSFYHLGYGYKTITVSKDGFVPFEQKFFLWKKDYKLPQISLTRDENHNASFSGTVLNVFDKNPIKGAIVTLGESTLVTDEKGAFSFKDMTKGDFPLKISAIGFVDVTEKISLGTPEGVQKEYLLSPYGKISFTSARDGKKNIYTVDYSGTNLMNLTMGIKADCWGSQFTPDGKKIVFMSNMGTEIDQWGQRVLGLYVMDADGRNIRNLSAGITLVGEYKITGDSKRVIFNGRQRGSDKYEIFIAGIEDAMYWMQLEDNDVTETDIDVSPDGTMVLYGVFNDNAREIYVVNIASREKKLIATLPNKESFVSFMPDNVNVIYVDEEESSGARVTLYDLIKDKAEVAYDSLSSMNEMTLSPNGDKLAFTSVRDDKDDIYILNIKDKSEVKLTQGGGNYRNIVWPKLEKILAFTISDDSGNKLAVMDISKRKITETESVSDDILGWSNGVFDNGGGGGL